MKLSFTRNRRMKITVVFILFLMNFSVQAFTLEELKTVVEGENLTKIHNYFNEIKRERLVQSEINEIFEYLEFLGNDTQSENLAQAHIIDILLQRKRNGYVVENIFIEQFREKLWNLTGNEDGRISRTAIQAIGMLDTDRDLDFLLQITKLENNDTFRATILSMSSMCMSFEDSKFENLLDSLSSEYQKIAIDLKESFREFIQRSGWCD